MSGAKKRKLTHFRDEQNRAGDERGAEQLGQERQMSEAKRRKLTHKRVEQRQGDERGGEQLGLERGAEQLGQERGAEELGQESGAEELGQESGAEELGQESGAEELGQERGAEELGQERGAEELRQERGAEELGQERGAEELRQERATNPVTKTSPTKKRLSTRDETNQTAKKRRMDAPLSSGCAEASTSSYAAVPASTSEDSPCVFVSRTKNLEQPATSQMLAKSQGHADKLKTRRSAAKQLQNTNRVRVPAHRQQERRSAIKPLGECTRYGICKERKSLQSCSSPCSKTEDTSAQQHLFALLVVPLLLALLCFLPAVVNQLKGDAGGGSQNLMENLQELKGLIPEEFFMHAERFVKDITEVPGSYTHLEKLFVLMKEHLSKISQKQKSDGDAEHIVKDITEVPGSYTHLEKLFVLMKEHLISQKQKSDGAKVKVYSMVTGQTFGAHQVLLDKVKNMSQSVTMETTRDLQESNVVIVFCPIASRVGSDVGAAMTDVTGSCGQKPVILVLMHHTRDVEYSTDGRRWSDVYDNVVLDVHVLFHETKSGLLTCPKNDQAVGQIQKELQKHSKHRGL